MIIGSISENLEFEKRVAITPDILKKYKSLGMQIYLCKDYATHIGINDNDFISEGASILQSNEEVLEKSNLITQLNLPNEKYLNKLKSDQILIGVLDSIRMEANLKKSLKKK